MENLIPGNRFRDAFFKKAEEQFGDTPKSNYEAALEELWGIALNGAMDKIQYAALTYIFDRILGKPAIAEVVEHEGSIAVNITRTDGRSKERFEEIKQKAKERWEESRKAEELALAEAEAAESEDED